MRGLTKIEKTKYALEIKKSRAEADKYVFGYRKKEKIRNENEIVTLAKGEQGTGWFVVASCLIKK